MGSMNTTSVKDCLVCQITKKQYSVVTSFSCVCAKCESELLQINGHRHT